MPSIESSHQAAPPPICTVIKKISASLPAVMGGNINFRRVDILFLSSRKMLQCHTSFCPSPAIDFTPINNGSSAIKGVSAVRSGFTFCRRKRKDNLDFFTLYISLIVYRENYPKNWFVKFHDPSYQEFLFPFGELPNPALGADLATNCLLELN